MSNVKNEISNVNKVKLLSERTSGVPPVIFIIIIAIIVIIIHMINDNDNPHNLYPSQLHIYLFLLQFFVIALYLALL